MFLDAWQPWVASVAALISRRGTAGPPPRSHRLENLRRPAGARAAHERGSPARLVRGSPGHRGLDDRSEDRPPGIWIRRGPGRTLGESTRDRLQRARPDQPQRYAAPRYRSVMPGATGAHERIAECRGDLHGPGEPVEGSRETPVLGAENAGRR
jgi:hypothetical protein